MTNQSSIKYISGLLENPGAISDGDQSSIALFRQTFPYFVPTRYLSALESHKRSEFSSAMMSQIMPYLGNWILFCDFLEEGSKEIAMPDSESKEKQGANSKITINETGAKATKESENEIPKKPLETVKQKMPRFAANMPPNIKKEAPVLPIADKAQAFSVEQAGIQAPHIPQNEPTGTPIAASQTEDANQLSPELISGGPIVPATIENEEPQHFAPETANMETGDKAIVQEEQIYSTAPVIEAKEEEIILPGTAREEDILPVVPATGSVAEDMRPAAAIVQEVAPLPPAASFPLPISGETIVPERPVKTVNPLFAPSKVIIKKEEIPTRPKDKEVPFSTIVPGRVVIKEAPPVIEEAQLPAAQSTSETKDTAAAIHEMKITGAETVGAVLPGELTQNTGDNAEAEAHQELPEEAGHSPLIYPVYTEDYFLHQGVKVSKDLPEEMIDQSQKERDDRSLMVVMSFSEWLLHFKNTSQKQKEEKKDQKSLKTMWQKEKLAAAMEEENEEIPENVFEMAVNSITKEDGLASESLANIYIKQGKYDKAIEMYRKLSLLNPKKNTYFARKIEEVLKEKQS
jgi:hypothetical protein